MSPEPREKPARPPETEAAVLMGDPTHFNVLGGANPHTRNFFGFRKRVSRALAVRQWHRLARLLRGLGVAVYVIPAARDCPGLVYPANAGIVDPRPERDGSRPRYLLSRLLPTRAAEEPHYKRFLEHLGFETRRARKRLEGEADFFPAGSRWIFTCGRIERQRFVPKLGFPPYRRVYGFRSDPEAFTELAEMVSEGRITRIELAQESYYHGDTVIASFGEKREHLLAYLEGLTPDSRERIRQAFGARILPLSEADASLYAANSFQVESAGERLFIMPQGVSRRLRDQLRERGVSPVTIDVSEFLKKGGGAVKCMIGDLGRIRRIDQEDDPAVREFRERALYRDFDT